MLRIKPFCAVRPHTSHASQVASLPYDVVDTAEARELASNNPLSFLHVVRSEIDLPPDCSPYDDSVYAKARSNLESLLKRGAMVQEDTPSIFLYRQVMDHKQQVGLVCCCHVEDYLAGRIKKHENTRPVKEDDRTRHVLAVNANTGPVFLTYRDQPNIDRQVAEDLNTRPMFHFDAPDRVTHTVWRAQNAQAYIDAFAGLEAAYVADGHHRSASAARAGTQRMEANAHHDGSEEYNWFLAALFPASQLTILPYNRIVRDLNGLSPQQFIERLGTLGDVHPAPNPQPDRAGSFCFFLDDAWHRLDLQPDLIDTNDPVESLDVALLQRLILGAILGIGDPRTDDRIDFVGGIRGTGELENLVRSGRAAVAVSMYPTSIDELLRVADAGLIMPPKSTWFEPKLRSGLFVHMLDEQPITVR